MKFCRITPCLPSVPHSQPLCRLWGPLGWALQGPKTHSWPEPLPHWDLPKISLPSQIPLHLFSLFQILNTSQELKDTDLEYLEVRRYQVLGCHPIPALTMRLEDWTRGTQMPSSSGPGFHGLERGWWVSDTRLEGG